MRTRHLLAAVAVGLSATAAAAQTTTGTGTTTTATTGTTSGPNITGLNGSSTGASNFQIMQQQDAPQITSGAASGANVQGSNAFAGYYGNPQYQGRAGSTGTDAPGGFGTALSGTSTTGARSTAGTAFSSGASRGSGTTGTTYGSSTAGRTGTASSVSTTLGSSGLTAGRSGTTGLGTTGLTGRTGTTGLTGRTSGGTTGFGTTGQSNGTIVPLPRQIAYTATMRMPIPAVQAEPMRAELRGVLDRSSMIANPKGIEVLTNGPVVVLRGRVKDEDEAKTAEGIVRLTPGVKDVQNELKY